MPKELDYRGLNCPEPVIRCRAVLDSEHPEELAVRVDNSAAVENVSRFLKRSGYAISERKLGANDWRIEAVKQGETAPAQAEAGSAARTLIFITTPTMGRGDEELGAKLMENFLATVPEFGESLWRVILLNGGVKLAATPGPCLEQLKKLAASGVGVFVCGTCLMHYGLLEQKQVGETTNMLDIVTSLSLADKIIRP